MPIPKNRRQRQVVHFSCWVCQPDGSRFGDRLLHDESDDENDESCSDGSFSSCVSSPRLDERIRQRFSEPRSLYGHNGRQNHEWQTVHCRDDESDRLNPHRFATAGDGGNKCFQPEVVAGNACPKESLQTKFESTKRELHNTCSGQEASSRGKRGYTAQYKSASTTRISVTLARRQSRVPCFLSCRWCRRTIHSSCCDVQVADVTATAAAAAGTVTENANAQARASPPEIQGCNYRPDCASGWQSTRAVTNLMVFNRRMMRCVNCPSGKVRNGVH